MLPKPRTDTHATSHHSAFALVLDPALHEVTTTDSRQIRHPGDFLHAVRWAVAQGLHPRATASTVAVAEKLVAKINREGHMAYARERLAAELHISLSTVRNHTRVLRELGLLVWVEHGTRRNILRTKNPTARPTTYKATATIFAAVAPPYWDRAMGRTTAGHGYNARLIAVDDLGRTYETALANLNRPPTGDHDRKRPCPPSVSGFSGSEKFGQKGGFNYTRTRENHTSPRQHEATSPPPVTPSKLANLIAAAEQIKAAVPWLAKVCARRLAFQLRKRLLTTTALAPLISELQSAGLRKPIVRPLGFLASYLDRPSAEGQRVDTPLTWVPAATPTIAPVELPKFEATPEWDTPDFNGDVALIEQWDAYCAQHAFAQALQRWRGLDLQRETLQELVPVYPVIEIPVDEEGERWTSMIEQRRRTQRGVLERTAIIRAAIRSHQAPRRP